MKKSLPLILYGIIMSFTCFGQKQESSSPFKRGYPLIFLNKSAISEISIADSFTLNTLRSYIANKKQSDSVFNKYGYITAWLTRGQGENEKGDKTSYCLGIVVSYYIFYAHHESSRFPLYITRIEDKMVLFYDYVVKQNNLKTKLKKRFSRMINSYLEPFHSETVTNEQGEKMVLWPSGWISLDHGITICL